MIPPLNDAAALERSGVVANNRMNRERRFTGTNSYCGDLRLDLDEFLATKLAALPARPERSDESPSDSLNPVAWLDLCCGAGLALDEAGGRFSEECRAGRLKIVGVDLVASPTATSRPPGVNLIEASLTDWSPNEPFDLITCVHGLHYVADKLAVLSAAVSWLKPEGLFAAHLDLKNLKYADDARFDRQVRDHLAQQGLEFHARFRRLTCVGSKQLAIPWRFLGADDTAGPNFTGQPAVDSWYGPVSI